APAVGYADPIARVAGERRRGVARVGGGPRGEGRGVAARALVPLVALAAPRRDHAQGLGRARRDRRALGLRRDRRRGAYVDAGRLALDAAAGAAGVVRVHPVVVVTGAQIARRRVGRGGGAGDDRPATARARGPLVVRGSNLAGDRHRQHRRGVAARNLVGVR